MGNENNNGLMTAPSPADPALSAVVPCCEEEAVLATLHRRLSDACLATGLDYELVFVDDGSRDNTWARLSALAEADPRVVAVALSRNFGHQFALTAGLTVARGREAIFILDADLQDPPELLEKFLVALRAGFDVAYGQRIAREGETWLKRATAHGFYRLLEFWSDTRIPLDTGDFRLLSRRALDALLAMPEQSRFIRGMVSWVGFRQKAVPYERQARAAGRSKYPLRKMLRFATDALTGFSIAPLRLATYLGLLFGLLAALGIVWAVYESLANGKTVRGWPSIMVAIFVTSSVQMLMLGIFGEYLGRLFVEARRRPLFIIREIVRAAEDAGPVTGRAELAREKPGARR